MFSSSCGSISGVRGMRLCDLFETNDWIETAGIGVAEYHAQFVFKNGLIKHTGIKQAFLLSNKMVYMIFKQIS